MKIELRDLSELRPYPGNPRLNDDAVVVVAASLREFGFRQPIVVDTDGVIIVGHTRYKAAVKLELAQVPVHVATDLTAEQIRAYRIADNQTSERSDWDYDLLPIELGELKACDYDLGVLGFDPDELARLLDPTLQDGLVDPDDVPLPPRRSDHPAGRSVDSRQPSPPVRRQQPARRPGPSVGRRHHPPGQHRPTLQREGRAALQQRHRRRPVVVRRLDPPPEA